MLNVYIRNKDLIPQILELLAPYEHLDLSHAGCRERTTAAEVLLGVAAQEVLDARFHYANHRFSNEHYPLEHITTVGNFIKALRTGTVDKFNERLNTIEDPEIREIHRLCMNARFVFVEPEEACDMRTTDEVLYHIRRLESYD